MLIIRTALNSIIGRDLRYTCTMKKSIAYVKEYMFMYIALLLCRIITTVEKKKSHNFGLKLKFRHVMVKMNFILQQAISSGNQIVALFLVSQELKATQCVNVLCRL